MVNELNQIEESYRRQAACEEEEKEFPSRFTRPDSVDNWRHTRSLNLTRSLREARPKAKWMTVGDGRYGSDAAYLRALGADVLATSLTDDKLRRSNNLGYIGDFRAENAEALSASDNSVDFVLCKEAYHHFPRPPVALYEMIRVARLGVMLIEPLDNPKLLDGVKTLIKRVVRGDREHMFEPSGNFIYRLDIRELGKLMTAMGGEVIACRRLNDFYHGRMADYPAYRLNRGYLVTLAGILVQDVLARLGLLGYGLVCVVVFKENPEPDLINALEDDGFEILRLPKNPYVK